MGRGDTAPRERIDSNAGEIATRAADAENTLYIGMGIGPQPQYDAENWRDRGGHGNVTARAYDNVGVSSMTLSIDGDAVAITSGGSLSGARVC